MAPDTLARLKSARVAVIGDIMIDEYLTGQVNRISPEAPVPVVRGVELRATPGGAANTAANANRARIRSLGRRVNIDL